MEKNLKIFHEKLNSHPEEEIIEAAPEIAVPVLEKLRYVRSEELVNLYTELLLKASLKEEQDQAHPGYLEILNSLSGDEAKLLEYLQKNEQMSVPYLEIRLITNPKGEFNILTRYFTVIDKKIDLVFPTNITAYFSNLIRLGIFEDQHTKTLADQDAYKEIFEDSRFTDTQKLTRQGETRIHGQKAVITITEYGKKFMITCIPKNIALAVKRREGEAS